MEKQVLQLTIFSFLSAKTTYNGFTRGRGAKENESQEAK